MGISLLFNNLRQYISLDELRFNENTLLEDIILLESVEFDESGQQLKQILESSYRDGISGFENVKVENGKITGVFIDIVNPQLTKKYEFSVDENEISYKLLNPDDIDDNADYSEPEFARVKLFGRSQRPKNCTKSTPCGNSCIKKGLTCRKSLSPEQAKVIEALMKTEPSGQLQEINYKINRGSHTETIELGKQFAEKYIKPVPETQKEKALLAKKEEIATKILGDGEITDEIVKLASDIEKEYSLEVQKRAAKENKQMEKLRQAIIEKHGISDSDAQAYINGLNFDLGLTNQPGAEALAKIAIKEAFLLSGGQISKTLKNVDFDEDRAYASKENESINVGAKTSRRVIFHEAGHHLEFSSPEIPFASINFVSSRADSQMPVKLSELTGNKNYDDDEEALKDKFIDPYVGKIYGIRGAPTEVVSMGFENFYSPGTMSKFAKADKEHFYFTIGVLIGEDKVKA